MENLVVSLGKKLGCICKQTKDRRWEIISPTPGETWKLSRTEQRWILSLNGVPQMYFSDQEAIQFLERRCR